MGYRDATFKQAICVLTDKRAIEEINKCALELNCRLSVCSNKDMDGESKIQFIMELNSHNGSEVLTILDKAKMSAAIKDIINYENRVFVSLIERNIPSTFEDITLFSPKNYEGILCFFKKHYPGVYEKPLEMLETNRNKRQRIEESSFFKKGVSGMPASAPKNRCGSPIHGDADSMLLRLRKRTVSHGK